MYHIFYLLYFRKWKADSVAVNSVCVVDKNSVLSASSSIKLWNIEQKTVIKVYFQTEFEVLLY